MDIIEIGEESFPYIKDPYMFFARRLREGNVFVLIEDGVIGFLDFTVDRNEIKLEGIAVRRDKRGKGYGKILMEFLLSIARQFGARRIYLMTLETNEAANTLYTSFGFTPYKREGPFIWYERYL